MANSVFISGPAGQIEAQVQLAKQAIDSETKADRWAIVCHPHPLFGGTMLNKVVTTLVKAYEESGINTVIFNYRGVGDSQGEYGEIHGEVEDAKAVLAWLLKEHAVSQLYFAGFSFGAYIAAKLAHDYSGDASLEHLTLIAPSVENSPFELATPIAAPCLVVVPEADEVVDPQKAMDWAEDLYPPVELETFEDTSHFFHGKVLDLRKTVKRVLENH